MPAGGRGFTFIWWLARGGREGGKEAWGGLGTATLAKRKARQLGTSGGDWGSGPERQRGDLAKPGAFSA